MKLLLDTTYLLPALGITVRSIPQNLLEDFQRRGHDISISAITIFELAAKGAKLVSDGRLSADRVERGLASILTDDSINQIALQEAEILKRAIALRSIKVDFIDCLILASAALRTDALVTEDKELRDLASRDEARAKLNPMNLAFTAYPWRKVP